MEPWLKLMLVSPELMTQGCCASLYKLVGKSNMLIEKNCCPTKCTQINQDLGV